jgi:hypothetical protein
MNLSATLDLYSNRKLHKRIMYQGLPISVENRAGSVRKGKDPHWGEWRTRMLYDYGYFKGTKGFDGGGIDVFVGPIPDAKNAYVVHIRKPPSFKQYDEDKCFVGFSSASAAKKAFMQHYDMPEKFFGGMDTVPMEEFRKKILKTAETGPTKITASMDSVDGNPASGIAHMDPKNTFHPPSLKNPQHVPTDDPGNTSDDRFLDITKRNDAETERYRKSRTSNTGSDGRSIPVTTTQVGLPPM